MRRSASEMIRNLERRITCLERQASNRTASNKFWVAINTGSPKPRMKPMTVKQLLSLVKEQATGRCVVNIIAGGSNPKVNFICPDIHWSCSVLMYELLIAIEDEHPQEFYDLRMNANVQDEGDDYDMAFVLEDYLKTSRGSFGGGLGRDWLVEVI